MSSRCRNFILLVMLIALASPSVARQEPSRRVLRIAADPNNLPFSDDHFNGFENKIARLIADDLNADLDYTWRPQRRCFFREMFKEGNCDIVMGVPDGFERALTTQPLYRSAYSFVHRAARTDLADLKSLDDSRLRSLKIGVQLIGADGANSPPAHALQRRRMIDNLVGFPIYGDYANDAPPARIIDAVANREVDVAIVWGPVAGFFAKKQTESLTVTPLAEQLDPPALPLAFDICIGVRKNNPALRDEIEFVLLKRRADIEKILREFGTPIVVRDSQISPHLKDETR